MSTDYTGFLGPLAEKWPEDRVDLFGTVADDLIERYGDIEDSTDALDAAAQWVDNSLTLADAADAWRAAKAAERAAMMALHGVATAAYKAGDALLAIERQTGLNRRTVRAAAGLGKQFASRKALGKQS